MVIGYSGVLQSCASLVPGTAFEAFRSLDSPRLRASVAARASQAPEVHPQSLPGGPGYL